ncbi:MAG: hypothetical protein D6722_07265 [Bacteroidetes bacterium]|nr:MAG: hypothetical protein D6722_07265 [Bacteroidota bacterium]
MKYWKTLAPILLPLLLYVAELLQRRVGLHLFSFLPVLELLLLPGIVLYYLWIRPSYLRYRCRSRWPCWFFSWDRACSAWDKRGPFIAGVATGR